MEADAASARRAGAPRGALQGAERACRCHPRGVHGGRARPAVPREGRHRRRHQGGRPPDTERRRRRFRHRRDRGVRALGVADVLHGVGRGARARRPAHPALPTSPAALARLLRAQPHRRDGQPHHERHRGARPARHRRRLEPRAEHARPRRDGRRAVPARLAPRPRDARRPPAHGRRDGLVPRPFEPRLQARPRAARARHRDARRGLVGHARRPVVHARADEPVDVPGRERALPRVELRDGRPQQHLLPRRRHPLVGRDRNRPRSRRLARRRGRDDDGNAHRLHALPRELLRPGTAALAALQHVPLRDRCARSHHLRPRREA